MRKIVYLCSMLLCCFDIMAQVDLNDGTWFTSFDYSFSNPNFTWNDMTWRSMDGTWKAYPGNHVTHGKEQQIYQVSNCVFDINNQCMTLVSEFDSQNKIPTHNYQLPSSMNGQYPNSLGYRDSLYYFSGEIDVDTCSYRYGYFEIRCKLPIHRGAFPAFWLWNSGHFYEEIDIFEFSWAFEDSINGGQNQNPHGAGNPYCFTTGIHFNNTSTNHNSYGRNYPMISDSLSNWHTFGCEWMPGYVKWYCDGNMVNEFYEKNHIPHRGLILKTNYAIDRYSLRDDNIENPPEWFDGGIMVIDYIKVWQHHWDCGTDVVIAQQSDLASFDHAVKKSVAITAAQQSVAIGSSDKKTFRITDSFEITGPFQANSGGEMTVIIMDCPEN